MGVSHIFKAASRRIADFCDNLRHSPVAPVPEVRKALEDKGYRFAYERHFVMGMHGTSMPVTITQVTSPDGKTIDIWDEEDARARQYRRDYGDAVSAYKAARRGPAPAP